MTGSDKHEIDYKKVKQENEVLLDRFTEWLQAKKLSEKTIKNHVNNVSFYINEFLLYTRAIEAKNGAMDIGLFLGDWFIRKAMWSSINQIKANIASLKKFYTFMFESDYIDEEELYDMLDLIIDEKDSWAEAMEDYENGTFWSPDFY